MDEANEVVTEEINETKTDAQNEVTHMNRCHWCNKEEENENIFLEVNIPRKGNDEFMVHICSPEHETRINKFYNYVDKIFILGLILIFLVPIIFVGLTLLDIIFIYFVFVSIGLGLIIYPLFSQQVIKALGLKKSNILARILGTIIVLLGIALYFVDVFSFSV